MTYCHESASAEPLPGTSPYRKVWLIIEQPGAWGREALLESDLPAGFGRELMDTVTDPEIGIVLARRPALQSVERRATNRRRLWLAHSSPAGVRMRSGSLDNVRDVLRWDWQAIKRGELPPVGRRSADPAMFLCVNGKKDASCAIEGHKIIDALRNDPELTGQIFEASHITGHRFAPTALMLPWGYLYGRLTEETARAALSLAWSGKTLSSSLRGRSSLPPWAQAADIAVRNAADTHPVDSLDVVVGRGERWLPCSMIASPTADDVIEVRHSDGRAWRVELSQVRLEPRMVSCGEPEQEALAWQATVVGDQGRWA